MSIVFLVPYVPIPRMIKRINTAYTIDKTSVIFWDRGTDIVENLTLPSEVKQYCISEKANEGNPLKRLGGTFKFSKKAFSILRKEKPSCIHVTKTDMLLLVWIYCITRRNRPKVIYEVSDMHKFALNDSKDIISVITKKTLEIVERIGCSIVDKLIVTSESFWRAYYSAWIEKDDVMFLPNTPQEEVFSEYVKKEEGRFKLGFIGKIRYKKQIKLMIDAAEIADIDVLIAGNGVDLEEISSYCKNMNNICVHGAYRYSEEISNLYSNIDCVYSVYDTTIKNVNIALPNRLYEAAFCELPIIASKGTELASIIENEEIGVAVEDGNLEELLEAIMILKDSHHKNTIAKNCKSFYNKWRYDNVNKNLIDAYRELV